MSRVLTLKLVWDIVSFPAWQDVLQNMVCLIAARGLAASDFCAFHLTLHALTVGSEVSHRLQPWWS